VTVHLRPYQLAADSAITHHLETLGHRSTLLVMSTGCHRAGQLVLMYDGSLRRVEGVEVGDQLMGPDSLPRNVEALARGHGEMVEIRPVKGEPWVVNRDHILTLVKTGTKSGAQFRPGGALTDVSVHSWQQWGKTDKHIHKLVRAAVDFPKRPPPLIAPYPLGVMLGDGSLEHGISVTCPDREVWDACRPEAERWGLRFVEHLPENRCHGFRFSSRGGPGQNPMLDELGNLGLRVLAGEKFIPDSYRLGSRQTRLEILAGLLDTDGYLGNAGYEYLSKSKRLTDDVAFIARSLGLAAYVAEKRVLYQGEWRP